MAKRSSTRHEAPKAGKPGSFERVQATVEVGVGDGLVILKYRTPRGDMFMPMSPDEAEGMARSIELAATMAREGGNHVAN